MKLYSKTASVAIAGIVASMTALTLAPTGAVAAPSTSWGTGPVVVTRDVTPAPKIVDLRVGKHHSFDRVVIDVKGKLSGYAVRYVKHLRYDGSGDPVPLKGHKFISVALTPATAHNRHGDSVYTGPTLQQYRGWDSLRGVAMMGDFEGTVAFGIALRAHDNFRVSALHHPNRIIIDLQH